MHFDLSAAVKSLYSSIKVSLFGLATATNTTHHPKAEAKTVEFAHLSLCHVLLPFVDSVFAFAQKKIRVEDAWRRGGTSQVMAPDLPLWAPLRSILGQKLSGNLRAQSLCVSPQKCHPFRRVKRFKLWFMRLCMAMHAIFDSEVHMSNNINNTCTQRKLSLPLQFFTPFLWPPVNKLCSHARMLTVIPHPKAKLWNRISQLFARETWLINSFFLDDPSSCGSQSATTFGDEIPCFIGLRSLNLSTAAHFFGRKLLQSNHFEWAHQVWPTRDFDWFRNRWQTWILQKMVWKRCSFKITAPKFGGIC